MDGSRVVDGTGPILLDEVRCTERESNLFNCSHNRLGVHDCDHSDDAGVNCIGIWKNYACITVIYFFVKRCHGTSIAIPYNIVSA